jgi:hypothetical protein
MPLKPTDSGLEEFVRRADKPADREEEIAVALLS